MSLQKPKRQQQSLVRSLPQVLAGERLTLEGGLRDRCLPGLFSRVTVTVAVLCAPLQPGAGGVWGLQAEVRQQPGAPRNPETEAQPVQP